VLCGGEVWKHGLGTQFLRRVDSGFGDRSADIVGERVKQRVAAELQAAVWVAATKELEGFGANSQTLGEGLGARVSVADAAPSHPLDSFEAIGATALLFPATVARVAAELEHFRWNVPDVPGF
jgi:hypothetical protein